MKKIFTVLFTLCLLVGCGSKEKVEVDYVNSKHNDIAEKVLGNALGKKETQEIFDNADSFDVYYEVVDEKNVKFTLLNNMDYYFTGEVDFDACPFKVSVTGLAPYGYASKTIECPDFEEESEYRLTGQLFSRNDEYAYNVGHESYYYEDDDLLYDYVLDLEKITQDDLKALVNYLYTENVLMNVEGEMWVRVYPKKEYDIAYEKDTEAAWNELDSQSLAGRIWLDAENDIAEIYAAKDDKLIERINLAK